LLIKKHNTLFPGLNEWVDVARQDVPTAKTKKISTHFGPDVFSTSCIYYSLRSR